MKTINRIRFFNPETCVRVYGISRELTNRKETCYVENPVVLTEEKPYHDGWNATKETVDVINRMLALPGVLRLDFAPYQMQVTLAAVFNWKDVHEDILEIIKEVYFSGVQDIEDIEVVEASVPKTEPK